MKYLIALTALVALPHASSAQFQGVFYGGTQVSGCGGVNIGFLTHRKSNLDFYIDITGCPSGATDTNSYDFNPNLFGDRVLGIEDETTTISIGVGYKILPFQVLAGVGWMISGSYTKLYDHNEILSNNGVYYVSNDDGKNLPSVQLGLALHPYSRVFIYGLSTHASGVSETAIGLGWRLGYKRD